MRNLLLILFVVSLASCGGEQTTSQDQSPKAEPLVHSFAIPGEARVDHLHWVADVNFDEKRIHGTANYEISAAEEATRIILDINGLDVHAVRVDSAETDQWWIGDEKPFLG